MTLENLINEFISSSTIKEEAIKYAEENTILNASVPDSIVDFFIKFIKKEALDLKDFISFHNEISDLDDYNPELHDVIVGIAHSIALAIAHQFEPEIKQLIEHIEKSVRNGSTLSLPSESVEKYIPLLNIFLLTKGSSLPLSRFHGLDFPGVTPYAEQLFKYNIIFAINSLMLGNKIPKNSQYNGLDFSKPIYPTELEISEEQKIPQRKGIKQSMDYYPYKQAFKLVKGDTGDNTFMATNGHKLIYVRGVKKLSPEGILASKIASFVSKSNFSSERLLDNKLSASRELGENSISASDMHTRIARKKYIETEKRVFPGTGLIDEVLNFVQETDDNMENYRFSTSHIQTSYLMKIDFDQCSVTYPVTKEKYERDILTKPTDGMYHGLSHVKSDTKYIDEKLYARLKLSVLTKEWFEATAEKTYTSPDDKKKAVDELVKRTNIALELFLENNTSKEYLSKNKNILNELLKDSILYVNEHFDEPQRKEIISSMIERISWVKQTLNGKIDIELNWNPKAIIEAPEHALTKNMHHSSIKFFDHKNKDEEGPQTPPEKSNDPNM